MTTEFKYKTETVMGPAFKKFQSAHNQTINGVEHTPFVWLKVDQISFIDQVLEGRCRITLNSGVHFEVLLKHDEIEELLSELKVGFGSTSDPFTF